MICCFRVNCHRLTARLYHRCSLELSAVLWFGWRWWTCDRSGHSSWWHSSWPADPSWAGGEKCSAALLLSCRWMELSVLSRGVSRRGYSPTVPGLRCWRLYKGRNRKTEERERERNKSCPIKHFFSPSRAHLTSHHPAVLLPWAQALTHLYVFPSDLSTSFLSALVNHELMYEGNF